MKRVKGSLTFVLVFVLMLSALLSGCSGNSKTASSGVTEDGTIVLDFWTFWGSDTRRPVIEKMIEDFNKTHENIKVKHTYLPWGDIWTKELAAVAAGNPPDIVIQDINSVRQRAQKDQAMNLSKFIKKDASFKDRYYPELWDAVVYKGDAYALPFNTDTRVLYYNKDLFKQAGLDPNKPPKTWEELWNYAEKLDEKNGNRYETIGYYPLWGIGADVWMLNADGNSFFKDGQPVLDDPTNVKTLNWIKKWRDKYGAEVINQFEASFGTKTAHPFLSGKVAMYTNMATFYTQIRDYAKDLNFGVAKLPVMEPGSKPWSWGGGFVAEIPKGASHPKASWKFIKYLTGKKAQKYWAVNTFDNVANIKAAEAAANSPKLSDESQKVYNLALESVELTKLTPRPLKAPGFINIVNPMIDAAVMGQKSAKEAMEQAQQKVEELIQKNKGQ